MVFVEYVRCHAPKGGFLLYFTCGKMLKRSMDKWFPAVNFSKILMAYVVKLRSNMGKGFLPRPYGSWVTHSKMIVKPQKSNNPRNSIIIKIRGGNNFPCQMLTGPTLAINFQYIYIGILSPIQESKTSMQVESNLTSNQAQYYNSMCFDGLLGLVELARVWAGIVVWWVCLSFCKLATTYFRNLIMFKTLVYHKL